VIAVSNLDALDVKLLLKLLEDPRAQIGELSETLGVARNTVQTRIRRLLRSGTLRNGGREVDLAAIGYDVVAFVTIEVTHRELDEVIASLRRQPQVLEVYEISGRGDVWCRLAAQDVPHLQTALRSLLRIRGVIRTETSLALHEHISYRVQPLLGGISAGD
jgi:DNA-binding Lrp family transcriptional regulator